jgi:hypothetical protein
MKSIRQELFAALTMDGGRIAGATAAQSGITTGHCEPAVRDHRSQVAAGSRPT